MKEIGTSKHERTAIEVTVLTKSMYYLATYDQLNCPCLAGVEVMAQRLAQLIDAYASGDASRPNFKGVRHFTSEVSSTCGVPVALRTFAHRKAKEEHDMEKLRHHGTGSHGPHSGAAGGDDDDEGGPPLGKYTKKRGAHAAKGSGKAGGGPTPFKAGLAAPAGPAK